MTESTQPSKLLCKDCKHSFVPWHAKLFNLISTSKYHYYCRKSATASQVIFDPVTGPEKKSKEYKMCVNLRQRLNENFCGPEGSAWEPKRKRDLFLMLTEK